MTETSSSSDTHAVGQRSSQRWLLIGAAVAAVAAWLYLEASGNAETGVVLFVGVFAVLAALLPGIRRRDDGSASGGRPSPERPPLGERLETLAAPGPAVWLLPFAVLPVMLITLPLAYHHSPGNNSIVGLAFACALLGGTVGTVLGSRIWTGAMFAVVTMSGHSAAGPIPRTLAERTSYAVGGVLVVVAVVGSLFA